MSIAAYKEPPRNCPLCPRLKAFREQNRVTFPDYHNAPVPAFGALDAKLLIVGLAPGLHGANATGRPFTGDYAGDLLYKGLKEVGLAAGVYKERADDGFVLKNCRVTNAVRCVPPQNKPLPNEIATCRSFLIDELAAMPHVQIILSLGLVSHNSVIATYGLKPSRYKFAHGAKHDLGKVILFNSYHCSRYNTNTKRLTEEMFMNVLATIKERLSR